MSAYWLPKVKINKYENSPDYALLVSVFCTRSVNFTVLQLIHFCTILKLYYVQNMIFELFNVSSVLLNAKLMNRSACIEKCGFFRHLPGEDFLADFVTTPVTIKLAPIVHKLLTKSRQNSGKGDLTVHIDASYDYQIQNFTWTGGKPIAKRYWATRFNLYYPKLTTRVIQGCSGAFATQVGY